MDDGHQVVSYGQAVVGASPWMEKLDSEETKHFFALVREEQLGANFVAEIRSASRHSREDVLIQAKKNHADRLHGHAAWLRQHRTEKSQKHGLTPLQIF
jgi:hypothetical protein